MNGPRCQAEKPPGMRFCGQCAGPGKRQEAQEHLTTATTMYREMGMTYWIEKAAAEMRDLG